MDIRFREAGAGDFDFARGLYFETMRWMIEHLFGWDQAHQEESFAGWFALDEVGIITADGVDAGWLQQRADTSAIFLGSLYIMPARQRQGIGTHVLRTLLASAKQHSKVVMLAVVKINPAVRFYQRYGFRITHEDEYKFYMRADDLS